MRIQSPNLGLRSLVRYKIKLKSDGKVLILDADQRSALAATRSLGARGIHVVVAGERKKTLSGSSVYCRENFSYPSPYTEPGEFIDVLKKEIVRRGITIIYPMTDVTATIVLQRRRSLAGVQIPFCSFETFDKVTNKLRLLELAQALRIRVPTTYRVDAASDLGRLDGKLAFPVVLKPYRSRIFFRGRWIPASVKYAESSADMMQKVQKEEALRNHPFLIQEYVEGQGYGVFALYDRGKAVALFAHRRLREKPPSGGISVFCESVPLNPEMCEIARRILDHVRWHGVAMVEFKVCTAGKPYLIEVNGRFWGSLQLAIDAGIDFPYLLHRLACGESVEKVEPYRVGMKSRWLLGDLDHLYLRFKLSGEGALRLSPKTSKWGTLLQFLKFFEKNVRYEVNRWNDMRPFIFELKTYLLGNNKK